MTVVHEANKNTIDVAFSGSMSLDAVRFLNESAIAITVE